MARRELPSPWRTFVAALGLAPLALTLTVSLTEASELDAAREAIVARDYVTAVSLLETAASAGEMDAQYMLAGMHRTGRGAARDSTLAFEWYRRAADSGHADARYQLTQKVAAPSATPSAPCIGSRSRPSVATLSRESDCRKKEPA